MRNDSGMNEELEALTYSEEYSNYIMENCHGDRIICNGDTLIEAQEEGYLWDDFLDYREKQKSKNWANFEKMVEEYMKSEEYLNQEG